MPAAISNAARRFGHAWPPPPLDMHGAATDRPLHSHRNNFAMTLNETLIRNVVRQVLAEVKLPPGISGQRTGVSAPPARAANASPHSPGMAIQHFISENLKAPGSGTNRLDGRHGVFACAGAVVVRAWVCPAVVMSRGTRARGRDRANRRNILHIERS